MEYTVEGTIIKVLPERSGTSARTGVAWRMAEYVIETIEQYPKKMVFTVSDGTNGRIARLGIKEGLRMKVWFDIDANEYDGKFFNRITAFDARVIE